MQDNARVLCFQLHIPLFWFGENNTSASAYS